MKPLLIFLALTVLLTSCVRKEKTEPEFYTEHGASFSALRHGDWTKNTWIRKPANLKMIHESFKKLGYNKLENLISKSDNAFLIEGVYIKRNFKAVMDSLELTYNKPDLQSKYYTEFWKRRKVEKNDAMVYVILKEFNALQADKIQPISENEFVNDTLVHLLAIEFDNENLNSEKAKKDFDVLKTYGFHQSAYNLLFERFEYSELELDRERLKQELTKAKEFKHPWLSDNQK
ncbi:hypothetical protein ACFFVB_12615 [Formosa undariae]|uniref:Lipoprotein n=1 Tax=Formosa undariae TaxID=1325436 RepID=A0ABV5F3A5_9FLAO